MPYPEKEDVEKPGLPFIRCLIFLQVADRVRKTKVANGNFDEIDLC